MKKNISGFILVTLLLFFSSYSFANNLTIDLIGKAQSLPVTTKSKIIHLVKQAIPANKTQDLYKEKVQIIYNQFAQPDYLLVYLLSARTYMLEITQIKVDQALHILSVIPHYKMQTQDLQQQPHAELKCPDENVEFISATPSNITSAVNAAKYIHLQANRHHYKTRLLLNEKASVTNYENWLLCPKLKGFYNISHGNNEGIFLDDGFLSYDYFNTTAKNKLGLHTVILFNSCRVVNNPLKKAIIEAAQAQKYAGGVTLLHIGPSEQASRCFWELALNGLPMTPSLTICNRAWDDDDIFGIKGRGSDFLYEP